MKFTKEEIARYRRMIDTVKTAEADEKQAASSGFYFAAGRIAADARLELKRASYADFPAALDEIEYWQNAMQREAGRVRELLNENSALKTEIERLREAHQSAALRVYEILDLLASDKPNKYKYTDQTGWGLYFRWDAVKTDILALFDALKGGAE